MQFGMIKCLPDRQMKSDEVVVSVDNLESVHGEWRIPAHFPVTCTYYGLLPGLNLVNNSNPNIALTLKPQDGIDHHT